MSTVSCNGERNYDTGIWNYATDISICIFTYEKNMRDKYNHALKSFGCR